MSPTHDLQLVIFDCDGVLVDSEVISNEVLARALTEQGLPTTLAEARRDYQGLLLADIRSEAEEKLGRSLPEDWLERYERDRAEVFHRELRPVPGAADAVKRIIATDVAVCVASQGKLEKTRLSLGLTGLRDLFRADALFSAYSVPRGKPHPDLFLYAAAAMQALPPCGRGGHRLRYHGGGIGRNARSGLRRRQRRGSPATGRRRGSAILG
jgi:beta-phosphoglucomutase-like phosphatase (HAD superfamily)